MMEIVWMSNNQLPSASPSAIIFPAELGQVVDGLRAARLDWRAAHPRHAEHGGRYPARTALKRIMRELGTALFPLRLGPPEITALNENAFIAASLESTLSQLAAQIGREPRYRDPDEGFRLAVEVDALIGAFAGSLPAIRRILDEDVEAAFAHDPAAGSVDEVLVAYPSILAIVHYRVAHRLHELGATLVARIVAELAHGETGIDIHPAARIGRRFFIDHGTGVVIGETARLGDRVRLFQGVTLGGDPDRSDDRRGGSRHPVLEDDVVVYANASLLGAITIGARSRIMGNVWLRQDVPADSLVETPPPIITQAGTASA
jgi:serine O-acetyltransferase